MDDTENTGTPASVASLSDARKRKKQAENTDKPEKEPKGPSMAELYFTFAQAINRTPLRTLPELRVKLAITEYKRVRNIILINDDDTCEEVPLSFVVSEIGHYLDTKLLGMPGYRWEYRHQMECAKRWFANTPPIEMPKKVRFKSEKGLCFHRLPFDLTPDSEGLLTPLWTELFSRMSNARAVMAWIGSLFVESSDRQQYVFIFGRGNDGKGSLARFLMRVFGRSAETQSSLPRLSNKHWAVPYEDKRLIIYPDFDDYESMTGAQLKALTGDDSVYIDPKGREGYSTSLICKLLFCSNKMPSISSLKADQRRIIFAEMTTTEDFDPHYGERLWAEAGAMLWHCITTYGELCPRGELITSEKHIVEEMAEWGSTLDEDYELLWQHCCEPCGQDEGTLPKDMQAFIERRWPGNRKARLGFTYWCRQQRGVKKKSKKVGACVVKIYAGVKLKSSQEIDGYLGNLSTSKVVNFIMNSDGVQE